MCVALELCRLYCIWSGLFSKGVHTQKGFKANWVQYHKNLVRRVKFFL